MAETRIAVLWDSVEWEGDEPSSYGPINEGYREFSRIAEERGAGVYAANWKWFKDGELGKAFRFDGEQWTRERSVRVDVVFDKTDFTEEKVDFKKRLTSSFPVINQFGFERLSSDKMLTYEKFPELVPETREATRENVESMLEEYGRVTIKPPSDYGGRGVRIIDSMEEFDGDTSLLVQRFVDPGQGIPSLDVEGPHDLRMLVVDRDIVKGQIRVPDTGLVSNVQRGGDTRMIARKDIPQSALEVAEEVMSGLEDYSHAVYSIDVIFDTSGDPWLVELNSKPGLVFYGDTELEEEKKDVMERVVETLIGAAGE